MKTKCHIRSRWGAFTLVEIVISIAILSVMVIAIYNVWASILRATKIGNNAADRVQRERIARKCLERSLASVQLFQENMPYYGFIADTEDEQFAFLSFVSRLPSDFPGGGMFPNQPLRRVTFEVEPDGSNGFPQLMMRQELLLSDHEEIDQSHPMVLVTNIGLFNVEFWDTNSGEWEFEWTSTNSLPPMLRLVMGYDGESEEDLYTSVIGISGSSVPRELHAPLANQQQNRRGRQRDGISPRANPR